MTPLMPPIKAPNAVAYDNQIRVMKRDPETDYCVKFTDGICAIHKEQGAPLLGDACNFYPRITRSLGLDTIMTATLSCPEIARLSLFDETRHPERSEGSFAGAQDDGWVEIETERLPSSLNNYQDPELSSEDCLKIHNIFLNACAVPDESELILSRIYSVASSLSRIAKKDWPDAAGFFLKTADGRLAQSISDPADKYKILQIFAAVFHATRKKMNPRLLESLEHLQTTIGAKIDWQTLELTLSEAEPEPTESRDDILKNYIAAQLSFTTFPFAGLGQNPIEKAKLLAFKFALAKLLIANLTDEAQIIQAIQSAARIIDHIASPDLIFNLMDQFGWTTEARILGLLY